MELTSHDRERDSCAGLECSFTVFMLLKKKKKSGFVVHFLYHKNNGKLTVFISCILLASRWRWFGLSFVTEF